MANASNAIDLWEDDEDFAERFELQLVKKENFSAQYDEEDTDERAVAEWGDFVDDFILECKAAARYIPRAVAGVPNYAAYRGALAIDTTAGVLYVNTSPTGASNGWEQVGASDIQDITSGDNGVLFGVAPESSTPAPIESISVAARFTLAGGVLDLATGGTPDSRLANMGARSLKGRSANSSGVPADIAGTGTSSAPAIMSDDGTSLSFRTLDQILDAADTIYAVDYSSLSTVALSGTPSIDSHTYSVHNQGNSTLFEILNGSGLHWDASTTNTAFSNASQTATNIRISWANLLGSRFDMTGRYAVDIRIGSRTLGVSGNRLWCGFIRNSITSATTISNSMGVQLGNNAGAQQFSFTAPSAGSGGASISATGLDVITVVCDGLFVRGFVGAWSSGWPSPSSMTWMGQGGVGPSTNADDAGYYANGGPSSALGGFVMAAWTGETGGAMDVVIRQIRVRRVR